MKKNRQPLLWTIGVLLIVVSIGGFGQGDFGVATFWLIVGIVLLPPVREKLFTKGPKARWNPEQIPESSKKVMSQEKISFDDVFKISSGTTDNNETTISLDFVDESKLMQYIQQNEREKQERIRKFTYHPQQIVNSVIQTFESIYIMNTTKSFDTLKGRGRFVEEKLDFLKLASHNKRYLTDVQAGIDQYKTMYYDKIHTQEQISILPRPNEFDYAEFHCLCLMKTFQKFHEEQIKQIAALKRESAIKNRREKIMDTIREIQMDIPTMAASFQEVNNKLEEIHLQVFNETYC